MKWMAFAAIICCGGLLLLILLGANTGLILGLLRNNWPVFLLGLLLIVGAVYYAWRYRYLKSRSYNDASSSSVQGRKGVNWWWFK